ncbi:type II toxin-antitoxin system VapC family toxin [Brevundimonas sp. R86498]|uniref:type II toxin-antitoxin system VapC family toxin n=1 Tax=Brevundimonas sp. R86498 TaxID=3093845 RepID=UPI0037C9B0F1
MNLLLDTHALVWWLGNSPGLSEAADTAIRNPDNTVFVSPVSAFEIAQKHRLGKLPSAARLANDFDSDMEAEDFVLLSLTTAEARLAGAMVHTHRDPFDRMLIARALLNQMTLVSNERLFDDFGVSRLW